MSVTLEITAGPGAGLRTTVTPGRTFTVGRQAGNDFVVAADHALSRNHFLVKAGDRGMLIAEWRSSGGTYLNGKRLERDTPTRVTVEDEIVAGNCTFRLTADAGSAADTSEPPPTPPSAPPTPVVTQKPAPPKTPSKPPTPRSAPAPGPPATVSPANAPPAIVAASPAAADPPADDHAAALDVATDPAGYRAERPAALAAAAGVAAPPAVEPGDPDVTAASHAAALLDGDPDAALKFLARALPPRAAVAWAAGCCESVADDPAPDDPALAEPNAAALAAAAAWAEDPTEANRRACEAAALALDHQTAAAWCAAAAFFSCGSIAPEHAAHVPANPALAAPMLHGALTLAAVAKPEAADDRRRAFAARADAHLAAPPARPAATAPAAKTPAGDADAAGKTSARPPTPAKPTPAKKPPAARPAGAPPRPRKPVRKGPPKLR